MTAFLQHNKRNVVRILVGLVLCASIVYSQDFFGVRKGGELIIYAQSLPLTKTFAWTDDPTADPATSHTVTLDGAVIPSTTAQSTPFTVTTLGAHVLTVSETNVWGTSPAATLNINVKVPAAPTAGRVQ